jgi:hypothetical protein
MGATAQTMQPHAVQAAINFVKRGEKVIFYATDRKRSHMPLEEHVVRIEDIRPQTRELALDRNGFVLLTRPTTVTDFYDEQQIADVYYPEIETLVKDIAGAEKVLVFAHVVRSDAPVTQDGGQPSFSAHIDYGDFTTREFATNMLGADEAKHWLKRRYLFMNLWRPITTVARTPLALCDPRTVGKQDLYGSEVRGGLNDPDRPPLYGFNLAYSPSQRWYYAPLMRPEEIFAFKIHDSDPARIGGVPHTAFVDPSSPPDAAPRESIEIRTISFMPE